MDGSAVVRRLFASRSSDATLAKSPAIEFKDTPAIRRHAPRTASAIFMMFMS
jgi:hypothetical protein